MRVAIPEFINIFDPNQDAMRLSEFLVFLSAIFGSHLGVAVLENKRDYGDERESPLQSSFHDVDVIEPIYSGRRVEFAVQQEEQRAQKNFRLADSKERYSCSAQGLGDLPPEQLNNGQYDGSNNTQPSVEMFSFTPGEQAFLMSQLREATIYFEYGSGGSTELACSLLTSSSATSSPESQLTPPSRLQRMGTVESNHTFLPNLITSSPCLMKALEEDRFKPYLINLGPTTVYGYPMNYDREEYWHLYPETIMSYLAWAEDSYHKLHQANENQSEQELEQILVLIDGRFRIASALYALFAFSQYSFNPTVSTTNNTSSPRAKLGWRRHRVLIHDFFSRPHYYDIFEYYDLLGCMGDMVLLQPKPNIVWNNFFHDITYYSKETR